MSPHLRHKSTVLDIAIEFSAFISERTDAWHSKYPDVDLPRALSDALKLSHEATEDWRKRNGGGT